MEENNLRPGVMEACDNGVKNTESVINATNVENNFVILSLYSILLNIRIITTQ